MLVASATIAIISAAPAEPQTAPGQATATAVTFTKDVLPIFQRSCVQCHRPGTAAPMSLLAYEDARPWARSIKERTVKRQMPPWHLDRSIGEYLDDPSLTDHEIATIARWVDSGAPKGNPADAPPPVNLAKLGEWAFGEPDLVVEMKQGFTLPVEGPDTYPSEIVDPGITEDRYVKWVQIIPTAYCCVHHSHVYVTIPDDADREGLALGMGSNTAQEVDLIEYAMGNDADFYPDGMAKKIPKGAKFRFAPHYHPWGKEIHDRQKVGIKFYPKGVVPKLVVTSHRLRTGVGNDWVLNRSRVEDLLLRKGYPLDLDEPRLPVGNLLDENTGNNAALLSIPPNTVARHERFYPMPQPGVIISFQPHMHFRGKRMLLEAIHLDGRREVLTDVPNYEQTWQITYTFKEPHLFPAGTILHVVSWHDNTAANPHNPDPTAWVGWGQRTMDEMGHGWTDIAWLTEEQYREELAKRANKRPITTTSQSQR
ncbi:MAG: cytochrome c [Acidobacteria bacterium]|nr:cytochrome c [Acidobacteriota bacterium]